MEHLNVKAGLGKYCLYNGDLSVDANAKAVDWLLQNVINKLENIQFIIAGKNPSSKLIDKISALKNVVIIDKSFFTKNGGVNCKCSNKYSCHHLAMQE